MPDKESQIKFEMNYSGIQCLVYYQLLLSVATSQLKNRLFCDQGLLWVEPGSVNGPLTIGGADCLCNW